LLSAVRNVNATNEAGNTPLILASASGHNEVVTALLAAGADSRMRNRSGQSALDLALNKGNREIVAILESHRTL